MKIDRQNYELYAIDFLDGKMTPAETAAFMAFLTENPDIAQEIELLRDIDTEIAPKQTSQDFSFLMKNINQTRVTPESFEEFCVAYHEGDLDQKSQSELIEFIAEDSIRRQKFEGYGKLKISPDTSIVFSEKNLLKQRSIKLVNARRIALITSFAAAASLALVFFLKAPSLDPVDVNLAQTNTNEKAKTEITKTTESNINTETTDVQTVQVIPGSDTTENTSPEIETSVLSSEGQNKILAAINDSVEGEPIRISLIDPKPLENDLGLETDKYAFLREAPVQPRDDDQKQPASIEEIKDRTTGFFALASGLTVDDLINSGVKGLNKMVEGNLSYQSERDEKGKMKEFALSADAFQYKRKIKNN